MTDVTVVIPTHNRRKLLGRTLRSVLAQQEVDVAVVVVDDGSSDGTEGAIRALGDRRVTVVRHAEARGVSAARNSGLGCAETPWVAFVDDDDLWAPGKLRAQLDALAATPAAGWASTGSLNVDLSCRVTSWKLPPDVADAGDLLLRQNVIPGGGSGVVASRDLAERIGGFDEAISNLADWDFYIRLALHAPMASVQKLHLAYLIRSEGMAHNVLRSEQEYSYLETKYGRERRSRGVELNRREWLAYLAALAYDAGHRRSGMRMHVELLVREHYWRSLWSILVGFEPGRIRRARVRAHVPPPMPMGVAAEAHAWLALYSGTDPD